MRRLRALCAHLAVSRQEVLHEVRPDLAPAEPLVVHDLLVERNRRLDSLDDHQLQSPFHARDSEVARARVNDDFRDQRIVKRRDLVPRVDECIDADARSARQVEGRDRPGDGANVTGSSALMRHSIA